MKIRILTAGLLLSVCLPSLVQAQNKIIIIRDDGTREEIIVNQPEPVAIPEEAPLEKIAPPVPTAADLLKEDVARTRAPEPASQAAPKPKVKAAAPPKKKTKSASQTKVKDVPQQKVPTVPLPKQKPNAEEIARAKAAKPRFQYIDPKNIPSGTVITRDLAVRAALEVAPPSRGFDVFSTTYKDRSAYQVRFKTEDGPHDVVIDGETGKVLKK